MTDTPLQDRDAFVRIVKDGLRKAEQHTAGLRDRNHGLLMASIAVGGHSWEEISREYGDIAKTYPEHFA